MDRPENARSPGGKAVLSRLPSLDGWRALSIAMVLGSHSTFSFGFPDRLRAPFYWVFDGNLGVRCFFLISGFLITWLMVVEHDRAGRVSLSRFYARRALRILPVYFGFLLTIAMLTRFTPYAIGRAQWIGNLTFTRNFVYGDFTTDHLWSLSVEEQFYIIWPGIFVALATAGEGGLLRLLRLLIIPVLLAPACRAMGYKLYPAFLGPVFKGYSFFGYFDSLAIGCAGAILLSRRREVVEAWSKAKPRFTFAVGLGLVAVTHLAYKLSPHSSLLRAGTVMFGPSAQALGLLILVLQSIVSPQRPTYRLVNWWWVKRIGVLSYSLYIWQQIFCSKPETFGWGPGWWISFPGWIAATFAVAFVSYYGFERPFLKLRAKLHDS